MAIRSLGGALASGGGSYARDDDPELVAEALPFGLKTIEGLIDADPQNRDLLLAAASGFTQYGTAFVRWEADYVDAKDADRAAELRARAKKLLRRGRDYGLRGLESAHPGFGDRLRSGAGPADATKSDVPLLYWTAAAWGSAISLSKDDAELTADLGLVESLLRRALELDETWAAGTIHDALLALDGGRPAAAGGSIERARKHFDRAVAISNGRRAAPYVTLAETVSIARQNRKEFEELLGQALAIDPDSVPDQRLANLLAQKRARWQLSRVDDLFLE